MSLTNARAVEPLYIVILRNTNQAEQLFRTWIRDNRIEHAQVSGNRMMLHDAQAFERFRITWAHSFASISVWDTWRRTHIYLD